jgi:putative ABC transport system ATP-binding protein
MPDDELTLYRRRRLGFIFQFFHLLPTLSAAENVALPLLLDGVPPADATRVSSELLERLGLGPRVEHKPRELSGGEQQRVAIARALVVEPALVLADEPTGNLDSAAGAEVYRILSELPSTHRTAVVMVTHDQNAVAHGTRSLRIVDGQIVD